MTAPFALVSLPWALPSLPSTQLGTLAAVLERAQVPTCSFSFHLRFLDHVVTHTDLSRGDYEAIAQDGAVSGAGDFAFAVPPYRAVDPARDEAYRELLRSLGRDERAIANVFTVRGLVPGFLAACADAVLAVDPAVVGFTTTFGQNVASLGLARLLKQARPALRCVFGGGNCEGDMGEELLRSFPWLDATVRGEAELILPELARALCAGERPPAVPGLCLRWDGEVHVTPTAGARPVAMDDVPTPDYREYFDVLDELPIRSDVADDVRIPFESSRGCWWGAKSHCTFCGLNGETMTYRSRSADSTLALIEELSERHRAINFSAVDNIIDMAYFETVLLALRDRPASLDLFYETKANLAKDQIATLYRAGVHGIQPGIESLSTPILKLMRKGVTGLQNVRLLKWCAEWKMDVVWNIIYAFPGEDPAEYARMARLIPHLVHLTPPNLVPLGIDRFSPYWKDPGAHGLRLAGPRRYYRFLYDVPGDALARLAYHFEATYADRPDHDRYVTDTRAAIDRWRATAARTYRSLIYRLGPGFLTILDGRIPEATQRYTLSGIEAKIYLACDAGERPAQVARLVDPDGAAGITEADVHEYLETLCASGLAMEESGKYLALAVADDPARYAGRAPRVALPSEAPPDLVPLRRVARVRGRVTSPT